MNAKREKELVDMKKTLQVRRYNFYFHLSVLFDLHMSTICTSIYYVGSN